MNPEAQRIAVAEACGWKDMVVTVDYRKELVGINTHRMRLVHRGQYVEGVLPVPDYVNDLNAIHEAEKIFNRGQQFEYHNHLWDILPCDENHGCTGQEGDTEDIMLPSGFTLLHAAAAQRAEAFLKTIGKWEP